MKPSIHFWIAIGIARLTASDAPPPAPEGCRWVRDVWFSDEFNGTVLDKKSGTGVRFGPAETYTDRTFLWHGLRRKEDLPVDFEIDYIRVWQKGRH